MGKTYKELLKRAKDKIEEATIPLKSKKTRNQLEKEELDIEEKILEQQIVVEQTKGVFPLDLDKILDAEDELDELEERKQRVLNLREELFPKNEK